jgi:alkylation response protein AidB-like acyl-CoA dehydrogenase
MEFGLSEEQVMLQDALARFLTGTGGLERTRAFAAGKDRRAPDVLQGLAELGVTGLIIPEVHGGVGLSLLDAALAAEQLGRFVAPAPFAATAVMAPLALLRAGDAGQQATWLPKLASGATVAGVALSEVTGARDGAGVEARDGKLHGRAQFVIDYEADLYIVADRARRRSS